MKKLLKMFCVLSFAQQNTSNNVKESDNYQTYFTVNDNLFEIVKQT